jgi:hypothetical protein
MDQETKQCPLCEKWLPLTKFKRNPDGSIRKHTCKSCIGKRTMARLKLQVFEGLGSKCNCCSEAHPYFLTVDHVQNNGAQHKRDLGSDNVYAIYRQVVVDKFDPLKWQLLCMNCNFAKGHYEECPHKLGITAEAAYERIKGRVQYTGKIYQNMNLEPLKLGPLSQKLDPEILRQHHNQKAARYRERNREILSQKERDRQAMSKISDLMKGISQDDLAKLLQSLS